MVNRKPILAHEDEIEINRRSRSAKLRVVEKLKTWDEKFLYQEGWNRL